MIWPTLHRFGDGIFCRPSKFRDIRASTPQHGKTPKRQNFQGTRTCFIGRDKLWRLAF
jgi:hypothetical protein